MHPIKHLGALLSGQPSVQSLKSDALLFKLLNYNFKNFTDASDKALAVMLSGQPSAQSLRSGALLFKLLNCNFTDFADALGKSECPAVAKRHGGAFVPLPCALRDRAEQTAGLGVVRHRPIGDGASQCLAGGDVELVVNPADHPRASGCRNLFAE